MLPVRFAVELLGSFLLVVVILTTGDPIAIAVTLLAAIYLGGKLSGGHFNPAVSTAMLVHGSIGVQTFIAYIIAQVAGGLLAVAFWNASKSTRRMLATGAKLV